MEQNIEVKLEKESVNDCKPSTHPIMTVYVRSSII
jgi:hypothetical protein